MTDENYYIVDCPHCSLKILIYKNEINCKIFRHGVRKDDLDMQLYQHATKEICDQAVEKDVIYGCGRPFVFDGNYVRKCDYI
jgi:hypothetical protein